MTQTATFPDLEGHPGLSDQAILYFAATMGTLTEVDIVTSGSFASRFSAENLAPAARTLAGTTSADLTIAVPTGPLPVTIPAVTQSFDASAFDGALDYGGTSGRSFAPATSSSGPTMTVLTSPADLAAFTGHFRMPIGVSGHASGVTDPDDAEVASTFATETSVTVAVIYHYLPDLPDLGPSPAGATSPTATPTAPPAGTSSSPGGANAAPVPSPSVSTGAGGLVDAQAHAAAAPAHAKKSGQSGPWFSPHAAASRHHVARQPGALRRHGPGPRTALA
jgi:hypothetical protein